MADTSIRSHERAASSRSGYPMAALGIALVLMVPVVAITAARGAMPLLLSLIHI